MEGLGCRDLAFSMRTALVANSLSRGEEKRTIRKNRLQSEIPTQNGSPETISSPLIRILFAEGESHVKLLATVSSIFICLAFTSATPKQDNPAKKFVGAWRLVAVEGSFPISRLGFDHPTGLIIYDQSGWMGVQIALKGTPKPFANGSSSGTIEEKAAAFDNYAAYYGTYRLDARAGTVTHHLENGSYPGVKGVDNVRWFEFQGNDRLILFPIGDGNKGVIARKDAHDKLIWERIK